MRHLKITLISITAANLILLSIGLILYFVTFAGGLSNTSSHWADFGSYFGGVAGPLLNIIAIAGVVFTINLQLKQIKEQEESGKQERLFNYIQNFENKFFKLMDMHLAIVSSLNDSRLKNHEDPLPTIFIGKNLLDFIYKSALFESFNTLSLDKDHPFDSIRFDELYTVFYDREVSHIGHYCRNTYLILKFIDQSEISDKKFYVNILKSIYSNSELGILAINSLSSVGSKNKLLIEKYGFLQNYNENKIIWIFLKRQFNSSAFN